MKEIKNAKMPQHFLNFADIVNENLRARNTIQWHSLVSCLYSNSTSN